MPFTDKEGYAVIAALGAVCIGLIPGNKKLFAFLIVVAILILTTACSYGKTRIENIWPIHHEPTLGNTRMVSNRDG